MRNISQEMIESDVLVVGGGCGGLWAALRAKELAPRVILAEKGMVARAGGAVFCHDLLAPMPEGELTGWLREVVEQAEFLSDQRYAELLLKEGGQRIEEMRRFGVPFEQDERGNLLLSFGRGHKVSRVVLYNGRRLMEAMKAEAWRRGVSLIERVIIIDLLTADGQLPTSGGIVGAVGLDTRSGRFMVFKVKAVVVATGLISAKLHAAFGDNNTGDGQAMAYRAGAEMAALEFTFSPNLCCVPPDRPPLGMNLIPFQTQGAYMINRLGERFMDKYAPVRRERGSGFGLLAQGIAKEMLEGRGPVYFDMRHFSPEDFHRLDRILPTRMATLRDAGIDPARDLIECRPIVRHFSTSVSGGVKIGLMGEASVPGLYAAGIAAQFPGCAEFLSGGMIAFCNVFGYRAGEAAARYALQAPSAKANPEQIAKLEEITIGPARTQDGIRAMEVYRRLAAKLAQLEYGIVKNEQTMKEMLKEIEKVEEEWLPRVGAADSHELIKANEARNFVHLLRPIFLSALERQESRLTHYRLDYPFRDDANWLKWVVVKKRGQEILIRHEPIPEESFKIKVKKERVPAPVQFEKMKGKSR